MSLPIRWEGDDCFTHLLCVGATRSGKTATILKPMIYQLLLAKKRGVPLGLSVIEPKGDVAQMVFEMCTEMEIPVTHIDPFKPDTHKFNPMEGDVDSVAEATVVVLQGLFGKQDAFFATVQELSARNVTKLLKELQGDQLDITDVMNTLRDPEVLKRRVAELRARDGQTDLVHFFESELLGSMADKYRQFVIGLRAQLENIVSNRALRHIMTGKGDVDVDKHLAEGGVLAVNSALGLLRKSGDAFGQFVIMHLQNGALRRPGTEKTRVPHFLIVDEYSRYINPDVEIFLSLAAEYRVAGILATQSLAQLAIESGNISGPEMRTAIMGNCRNLIAFGGLKSDDAKAFAEEFGRDKVIMRQSTYKNRILIPRFFPDQYRDTEQEEYRFDYTDIMDGLPRFHFIHKLVQDGSPQPPGIAMGSFVPKNWKELREWEEKEKPNTLTKLTDKLFKKKSVETEQGILLPKATEELSDEYEESLKNKLAPNLEHLEIKNAKEVAVAVNAEVVNSKPNEIADVKQSVINVQNEKPIKNHKYEKKVERGDTTKKIGVVQSKEFSFNKDLPNGQDDNFW